MQAFARPAYLSRFLFYALLNVAPYCVPGGVKVVSDVRGLQVAGSFSLYRGQPEENRDCSGEGGVTHQGEHEEVPAVRV